jgi:hypothetical protein
MWNYPSAKAANSTRSSFPVASSSAAGWMPRRNGGLRSTRPIGAFGFEGRAQRGTTGFCLASKTDWQAASITHATAQHIMVRSLIERDQAALRFVLINQGRAVLAAMLAKGER